MKQIYLPDGTALPILGQGTWKMGEGQGMRSREIKALQLGIELGMTVIDTAEMYGEGNAEVIVGEAIQHQRNKVFVVTKAYPHHASKTSLPAACERSLKRLKSDYIDLYLLHWRGNIPLPETVEAFKTLRKAGKIRYWGVSNFDVQDLEELNQASCTVNQVIYNPLRRNIESELMVWCDQHQMIVMGYSPLGEGGSFLRSRALKQIAKQYKVTPAQIAIAWSLRSNKVLSIPKATNLEHVRENAAAAELTLTKEDLDLIDAEFPPPVRKEPTH